MAYYYKNWRTTLGTICGTFGITENQMQWTQQATGTAAAPAWTAIVYYNGVEYGRGTAKTLEQAKEMASQQAMLAFRRMLGYTD
ncbi:hypothetical protein OH77DRAFT_1429331 [Trametes cingulata]|nr:hypothetical protein OH77DRAFT_1429331 [Trametes cingulata]